MKERWKDIIGWEGYYQISNHGRVKSIARTIIRKDGVSVRLKSKVLNTTTLIRDDYFYIGLMRDSELSRMDIHKLVGIHFVPNPKKLDRLNHKDRNRKNNYYKNLEWVSTRENLSHKYLNSKKVSKYTGVSRSGKTRWASNVEINKKKIYLGTFATEKQAGIAYKNELKKHGLFNRYAL